MYWVKKCQNQIKINIWGLTCSSLCPELSLTLKSASAAAAPVGGSGAPVQKNGCCFALDSR